jgi:hypothetical protein
VTLCPFTSAKDGSDGPQGDDPQQVSRFNSGCAVCLLIREKSKEDRSEAVGEQNSIWADYGMSWDNSGKNAHDAAITWSNA